MSQRELTRTAAQFTGCDGTPETSHLLALILHDYCPVCQTSRVPADDGHQAAPSEPERVAPVGADRVRRGYMSATERGALAALLETVTDCLGRGLPVPQPIRETWAAAELSLSLRRSEFR